MTGSAADRVSLREVVDAAVARLTAAGIDSSRADALHLAAHACGTSRADFEKRLLLGELPADGFDDRFARLLDERAARVPLQHLTGRAPFRHLELQVGPGVFVPRPETEDVAGVAIEAARSRTGGPGAAGLMSESALGDHSVPVVVDLCTGSGAIALAVADEVPGARVLAVEVDPHALAWAERNAAATGLPVEVVAGDAGDLDAMREALAEVWGAVDVVVSNPPYIPVGMVPNDPEVREHDPAVALYGGSEDGLRIPLAVAEVAAGLLAPGGLLVMEHAETQGVSLPKRLVAAGWQQVEDLVDLTGRPRMVVARRA